MRIIFFCFFWIWNMANLSAQQKLFAKNGTASFFSKASLENIEAKNNKLISVWDVTTGQIEFSILIKGFEFEKQLMQEHFNENYMESDKYPKAVFKGFIDHPESIIFSADGNYPITVTGILTMHGVAKQIKVPATIQVKNKIISASANFTVVTNDYKIKIPALVADNISKNILIKISIPVFLPMNKK
jgi:hypothetical protein